MTIAQGHVFEKPIFVRQAESAWTLLRNLVSVPGETVSGDPIKIVKQHLMDKFDLAASSAYQRATMIVNDLISNKKVMTVTRPSWRGRNGKPPIESFEIFNSADIPFEPAKASSPTMKDRVQALNVRPAVNVVKKSNGAANNGHRSEIPQTIAIWVDTPNVSRACTKLNVEIPIEAILIKAAEMGKVVFTVAFINSRCPETLMRMYRSHNFLIANSVPLKSWGVSSDPIDDEINCRVREYSFIADHHIIVSGDKDFSPLISYMRMQGKTMTRFQMDNDRPIMRVGSGEQTEYIQCEQKQYRGFSSFNQA